MSESNENNKLIDQVQEAALKEVPAEDIDLAADIPEVPAKAAKKSKKSKKSKKCPVATKKTTIGGQALIEGVMMVGPSRTAMAVRKGDGTIYVEEIKQSEKTSYFEKVPFIRGCIRFYKMLVTGTGALMKAADISEEGKPEEKNEGGKKSRLDEFAERHFNAMMTLSAIVGILLSVGLFILAPRLIVEVAIKFMPESLMELTWVNAVTSVAEGLLRLIIFLLYLIFASKLKDIKRVWRYHGAEHKTIACYEAGLPLTVENVLKQTRFHPRCGTSFMFNVLAISIIIYTVIGIFTGAQPAWVNIAIRIVAIPIICSISYEILRFVGRHDRNWFCRLLSKPGLWLQKFTTDEPDAAIAEVAIASMQAVIPENKEDDNW
ncbi:MAG: DUF1385 domain-containing protein [Saccharofermentans sp.]|nr:DUF1385 domain-containing protein [Saccharofermentans sp.]